MRKTSFLRLYSVYLSQLHKHIMLLWYVLDTTCTIDCGSWACRSPTDVMTSHRADGHRLLDQPVEKLPARASSPPVEAKGGDDIDDILGDMDDLDDKGNEASDLAETTEEPIDESDDLPGIDGPSEERSDGPVEDPVEDEAEESVDMAVEQAKKEKVVKAPFEGS